MKACQDSTDEAELRSFRILLWMPEAATRYAGFLRCLQRRQVNGTIYVPRLPLYPCLLRSADSSCIFP